MNRRELICGVSASLIATSCPLPAAQDQLASVVRRASVKFAGRKLAPLYAVAYVNPLLPDQQGQETTVAKYPMALVPQDDREPFRKWRDQVRQLNPLIVLLGYQMTSLETTSPGPGHDRLRLDKGLFLDQCSVFLAHSSFAGERAEMRALGRSA